MTEEINICPVCDMIGAFDRYTMQHNNRVLHFCSEQCRETFVAHPALYLVKADRGEEIKQRMLRMAETPDAGTAAQIRSSLLAMMGIKDVAVDGDRVRITYDLLQVTEEMIEKSLADAQLPLSEGWLERLHRAWVQGNEKMELENLSVKPAPGCHRMPSKK